MSDWRTTDIVDTLSQCRDEIVANMASKGENASGRTARSFVITQDASGIALILSHNQRVAPLETLEIGRPPGNVPGGFFGWCRTGAYKGKPDVSKKFKSMLMHWADEKGFADFGWAQATVLGRKIAYEGTQRHKSHVDIYSTPVNKASATIQKQFTGSVIEFLQQGITQAKSNI